MPRIAILGAGIAGLSAALRLSDERERGAEIEIGVYDRAARAGGCIQTIRESGYVMELGPDSLLAAKPAARELLQRLDLEEQLVPTQPEFRGSRIVSRGRLRPIPSEFRLFTPTSMPALLRSGIFSAGGIARAALEPFVPARRSTEDESLASFVTRRFGGEVLERLAQPLIGGIYSGDPQRLSMQATLPQLIEMERKHGSLLRGMAAARTGQSGNGTSPQLMSLRDGLQTIVDAILDRIGPVLHVSSDVTALARDERGWNITFAGGATVRADAVICALPAYAAARALRATDPQLAGMLERIRYNSIATVNLAYDAADATHLPATPGFVVPYAEQRRITAVTIATQKYPGRSPAGGVLLRAFIGGALQADLVQLPDEELARVAREEIAELLEITAQPRFAVTRRWMRMLPEYGVGHVDLVKRIDAHAAALGGLTLCGSAYHGVGIPDCAATGTSAAQRALQDH